MAIWLIRAGSHGENEQKFIQENRVYSDPIPVVDGLPVETIAASAIPCGDIAHNLTANPATHSATPVLAS